MLSHPFVQSALLAGTAVAILAGVVGYFLVLRAQVFAADALSHAGYTGAVVALAAGADLRFGLFGATVAVGAVLALLGGRGPADDVVIGTVFAWILGLGVFFLSVYTTRSSSGNGAVNARVLFGSLFGISAAAARTAAVVAAVLLAVMLIIGRPLMFASADPAVAAARGVPTRALGLVFLMLVGAAAAEASQIVGALLLLGLLAAPGGAALTATAGPVRGLALSVACAVTAVWGGIGLSYAVTALPVSFSIMSIAAMTYLAFGLGRQIGVARKVKRPLSRAP